MSFYGTGWKDRAMSTEPEPAPAEPIGESHPDAGTGTDPGPYTPRPWWVRALLWMIALFIMAAAVVYQRRTGPTYPLRGEFTIEGQTYRYKLVRSEWTTDDARAVLPDPGEGVTATLHWRRYPTEDPIQQVAFQREGEELVALLPKQPAAGKLEYFVEIAHGGETIRIPEAGSEDNILIRFKDPVPGYVLWPHIIMMFFSVLIGMRAGLAALCAPEGMRRYAWTAFGGMTLGGMILGPIVQKYAFGAYWTGFPWGKDLTDNKMLIMWLAWLTACGAIGLHRRRKEAAGRAVVLVAAVVMTAVYLIPHSMRGSELDYSKVEQGVDPSRAIGTGDE